MYFGTLKDWDAHRKLLPAAIVKAVEAVQQQDLDALPVGRYELDGTQAFFMIQEMDTRLLANTRAEAHRQYADVQIVLKGPERFGVAPGDASLLALEDNLEAKDIAFYPQPAFEAFVDLGDKMFAVFFPGEFHRPCCAIEQVKPIRKVVIKVHRSLLGL